MVTALVVTERQNTPKITFFTAVSQPFYNVQLLFGVKMDFFFLFGTSKYSNKVAKL